MIVRPYALSAVCVGDMRSPTIIPEEPPEEPFFLTLH